MRTQSIILATIAIVAPTIQAHSIWIEREKSGEAKAYFGEWQDGIKEKKGGYLDKLTGPKSYLGGTLGNPLPLTRQDDHFAIEAKGAGDVRLIESTFKPYDDKAAGGKTRVVFLAKEGAPKQPESWIWNWSPPRPAAIPSHCSCSANHWRRPRWKFTDRLAGAKSFIRTSRVR